MKTKKSNLKLKLNKVTISNLKNKEMTVVRGGLSAWYTCGETNRCGTGYQCTQLCECTDYPCTRTCM